MLLTNPFRPDPRVRKEARSLIEAGYDVTLLCWDRRIEYPPNEIVDGIKINRIQIKSGYSSGSKQIFFMSRYWLKALNLLNTLKPDFVHCHDLDTAIVGYLHTLKNTTAFWIYDAHECYPEQISPQVSTPIGHFLNYLDKFLSSRASHILTVGNTLAEYFRSYNKNVTVVGNYHKIPTNNQEPNLDRSTYGYHADDYLIGYIGGFTNARAIIPLIQSSIYHPGCKFLIAGDGPQREQVEKLLQFHTNVRYLGWVVEDKAIDLFHMCDVVYYGLYPGSGNSRYSTPNALFKAMVTGTPLISTDIGDIAKIIKEEDCGIVISQPIPELISGAIAELADPERREFLGRNGRLAARNKYNWEVASKRLLDVYSRYTSDLRKNR